MKVLEIKFNDEEKNILIMILKNELEYYERKEDIYEEDIDYIKKLKKILNKLERGI